MPRHPRDKWKRDDRLCPSARPPLWNGAAQRWLSAKELTKCSAKQLASLDPLAPCERTMSSLHAKRVGSTVQEAVWLASDGKGLKTEVTDAVPIGEHFSRLFGPAGILAFAARDCTTQPAAGVLRHTELMWIQIAYQKEKRIKLFITFLFYIK